MTLDDYLLCGYIVIMLVSAVFGGIEIYKELKK